MHILALNGDLTHSQLAFNSSLRNIHMKYIQLSCDSKSHSRPTSAVLDDHADDHPEVIWLYSNTYFNIVKAERSRAREQAVNIHYYFINAKLNINRITWQIIELHFDTSIFLLNWVLTLFETTACWPANQNIQLKWANLLHCTVELRGTAELGNHFQ